MIHESISESCEGRTFERSRSFFGEKIGVDLSFAAFWPWSPLSLYTVGSTIDYCYSHSSSGVIATRMLSKRKWWTKVAWSSVVAEVSLTLDVNLDSWRRHCLIIHVPEYQKQKQQQQQNRFDCNKINQWLITGVQSMEVNNIITTPKGTKKDVFTRSKAVEACHQKPEKRTSREGKSN